MLGRAEDAKLKEEPAALGQAVDAESIESRASAPHLRSSSQEIEASILEPSNAMSKPCAAPPLCTAVPTGNDCQVAAPKGDAWMLSCEAIGLEAMLKILEVMSSKPHGLLWEYDTKS